MTIRKFFSKPRQGRSTGLSVYAAQYQGTPYTGQDVFADTWVAVDGAGRTVPGFSQCGPVKQDKWVGIFYWTWHHAGRRGPYDNTKILLEAKAGKINWPE